MAPSLISLESLSDELLLQITRYLDDSQSLARVALVSRQFYRIANPELYTNPCRIGRGPTYGVRQLLPFTWLMIKSPDLASLVRSFSIRGCFGDDARLLSPSEFDNPGRLPFPPSSSSDPDFSGAISDYKFCDDEFEEFITLVENGSSEDAVITLLLTRLPNLRRLRLEVPPESVYLDGLFQDQALPIRLRPIGLPALARLEEVMIIGQAGIHASASWAGACFNLPALQRVYCSNVGIRFDDPIEYRSAFDKRSSSVTEIELRSCTLHHRDLDKLVRSCKQLKTFIYELSSEWQLDEMNWIRIVLNRAKDDLQNLCLYDAWGKTSSDHTELFKPMHFSDFGNLRFMKISVWLLFGEQDLKGYEEDHIIATLDPSSRPAESVKSRLINAMPPTLQRLHVSDCTELLKRDQANAIFAAFVRDASLLGFKELVLYDVPADRLFLDHWKVRANDISSAAVGRGFTFSLLLYPDLYFEEEADYDRGWGMEGDVRWGSERGKNADAETECFEWNFEKGRLVNVKDEDDSTNDETSSDEEN
jgi:hypothetical protein